MLTNIEQARELEIGVGHADYIWTNYLLLCCQLAAHGFLSRPAGDMTVPRIREDDGRSVFGQVFGGIKETFIRYPEVFIGAALANPKMFGKAAVKAGIQTLMWMGNQATDTGDRVPWKEDWAPVLVARDAIGIQAKDRRQYHTFGETPDDTELPNQ
jgi:hypothetical protein